MPTSETFIYLYTLSGHPSTGFSNIAGQNANSTLTDTRDGDEDGVTNVGEEVLWNITGNTTTLAGFSASGNPVLFVNGMYYIPSNVIIPFGDIGFTTEGVYAYCFAAGTQIAGPGGSTAVESLRIGDMILTSDGRTVAVKWIGRQTLSTRFAGHRSQPVRIHAGALGDGLPQRDLTVTADHGMILDGLVINAGALVNGTTIALVPLSDLPARVTYYHVETEAHDVIVANGAAAETFVDYAGRAAFDNHDEYLALYGGDRIIPEMRNPRITAQRHLPEKIRARLGLDATATLRAQRGAA